MKKRAKELGFKLTVISLGVLIILLLFSTIFQIQDVDSNESLNTFTDHLETTIPELMGYYDVPGLNIALIKNGKQVWADSFGYANVEQGQKMAIDTVCRVESITKSVTAWGIMKLVESGKIELDVPITQYLNDWDFSQYDYPADLITPRMLLNHTAGLSLGTIGPDALYSPGDSLPPLKEILKTEFSMVRSPGEQFYYSDTGYNMLELLVESVSGKTFADYMKEEVLVPLGMTHSGYDWDDVPIDEIPLGYNTNKVPIPVYTYAMNASGNLFSTLADITTFIIAGMVNGYSNQTVLKESSIEQLYDQSVEQISGLYGLVFDGYGLGHFIEDLSNGERAISHGGQGTGWMTHFHSIPSTGDGVVILSNSQRTWPVFSNLLRHWSKWSGFSPVGMAKLLLGQKLLWGLIAGLIFFNLWKIWDLIEDLVKRKRQFLVYVKGISVWPIIMILFALVILTVVYLAVSMTYQPLFSIFPVASYWFFSVLVMLGFVLLFLGFFPVLKKS